jgi:hypothetical protein
MVYLIYLHKKVDQIGLLDQIQNSWSTRSTFNDFLSVDLLDLLTIKNVKVVDEIGLADLFNTHFLVY